MVRTEALKIFPLLHLSNNDKPFDLIDFKRDLKAGISLNKTVNKDKAGRPIRAVYSYQGETQCYIDFIFELTPSNLISRRTEKLYYLDNDGNPLEPITIKDKTYDFSDLVDLEIVVAERENSRKYIISKMKGFLLGVMQQYNPASTADDIVCTIKPFWDNYKTERELFVDLGLPDWKNAIASIDSSNAQYNWLDLPINTEGVTVRMYMVDTLTY